MADDLFAILELPRSSDAQTIDAAYWATARRLSAEQAFDPAAASTLERLNDAYHSFARAAVSPLRRASQANAKRWRRPAIAAVSLVVVGAAVAAALALQSRAVDLAVASRERAANVTADLRDRINTDDSKSQPQFMRIANTGGEGAFLRVWPSYAAQASAGLADGSTLVATGNEVVAGGEKWQHVVDAQGREGWIAQRWLAPIGK